MALVGTLGYGIVFGPMYGMIGIRCKLWGGKLENAANLFPSPQPPKAAIPVPKILPPSRNCVCIPLEWDED